MVNSFNKAEQDYGDAMRNYAQQSPPVSDNIFHPSVTGPTYPAPPAYSPDCPHCGRCPSCGRGGPYPQYPYITYTSGQTSTK